MPVRENLCSATGLLKLLWTPEKPGYIAEHVQCSGSSDLTPHLNITNYFLKNQNTGCAAKAAHGWAQGLAAGSAWGCLLVNLANGASWHHVQKG